MRTPGFTATTPLGRTPHGGAGRTKRAVLDATPAIVPAEFHYNPWSPHKRVFSEYYNECGFPAPDCPFGERPICVPGFGKICTFEWRGKIYRYPCGFELPRWECAGLRPVGA
jgi:hypothetical protein